MPDSVLWYLTLLLLTAAFAPVARMLAGRLPDQGAFIAKPVGLLALVWPGWLLASVSPVPYWSAVLWVTIVAGGLLGWVRLFRRQAIERSWLQHLLAAEFIFLVAFVGFVWLRGYTPQITGTEKPMDIALLSASARATEMPPPDPWMAGETINYYYLGFLIHGTLSRLSDIPTWIGFNLALATTFAMTATVAAGLGYGIVHSRYRRPLAIAAGALAAFLIAIAGNLHAPVELLRDPGEVWDAFWFQGPGWEASRVVVDSNDAMTINEFPSFSFILGDLHPHVMALPFTLTCLTVALAIFLSRGGDEGERRLRWPAVASLALAGVLIGSLYPLNSWDFPTYLAAALVAILLAYGWSRGALERAAVLGIASVVAWAPFWVTFVPFAGGDAAPVATGIESWPVIGRIVTTVGAYTGERTSVGEFLTVFGLLWAVAVVLLAVEFVRATRSTSVTFPRWVGAAGIALAVVALGIPAPVLLLAGLPLAASIWLIERREECDVERTVIATLFAAGFGLILVTEFFYIQDVFSGRLNTLFKVYYQVWTLLGIASAIAIVRLWRISGLTAAKGAVAASALAVVLLSVTYPIVSAKGWIDFQGANGRTGLDGAAFIAETAPDDLAAIEWLAENAEEGDVILEAAGCSYTNNFGVPTNRISAFTGVPTIIGWEGHEWQWRGGQPELLDEIRLLTARPRAEDVRALFENPSDSALLDEYGVTLLYVGSVEREGTNECETAGPYPMVTEPGYPGEGWTEVFASGDARVYRRTG